MKKIFITTAFVALSLFLVFVSSVGISTTASNHNKHMIDSLSRELTALKAQIEDTKRERKDTVIVNVNVKPQVIKVNTQCID